MSKEDYEELACQITESLFTDGAHRKATRLLLVQEGDTYSQVVGGNYLGGLSQRAVTDRVRMILLEKDRKP